MERWPILLVPQCHQVWGTVVPPPAVNAVMSRANYFTSWSWCHILETFYFISLTQKTSASKTVPLYRHKLCFMLPNSCSITEQFTNMSCAEVTSCTCVWPLLQTITLYEHKPNWRKIPQYENDLLCIQGHYTLWRQAVLLLKSFRTFIHVHLCNKLVETS